MSADKDMTDYGTAIRDAFAYLLKTYPEVFVIGQGLWSPWYVGNSMTKLDQEFGIERIIDTPVSESACTGAAIGAAPTITYSGTKVTVTTTVPHGLSIGNEIAVTGVTTSGANPPNGARRI